MLSRTALDPPVYAAWGFGPVLSGGSYLEGLTNVSGWGLYLRLVCGLRGGCKVAFLRVRTKAGQTEPE